MNLGMGWLNLGSFVLGIISWILPLVAIWFLKNKDYKMVRNLAIVSLGLTIISLNFQFIYTNYLVYKGDWIAIEDTNNGVLFAVGVLTSVTFGLNFINMLVVKINNKINKETR